MPLSESVTSLATFSSPHFTTLIAQGLMGVTWCRTHLCSATRARRTERAASPQWHNLPKLVPLADQVCLTLSVTKIRE